MLKELERYKAEGAGKNVFIIFMLLVNHGAFKAKLKGFKL
jgi:hypothetical protein